MSSLEESSTSPTVGSSLSHTNLASLDSFNLLSELNRMYGTFRAQNFSEKLMKKHRSEPFECWTACEDVIRGVREDVFESARHRTDRLVAVIDRFVRDTAVKAIPLSKTVKTDLLALLEKVKQNAEFWDGRPLLLLQREASLLLMEDVREFFLENPWTENDYISNVLAAGMVVVSLFPAAKMTPQKKEEILRKKEERKNEEGEEDDEKVKSHKRKGSSPRLNRTSSQASPRGNARASKTGSRVK